MTNERDVVLALKEWLSDDECGDGFRLHDEGHNHDCVTFQLMRDIRALVTRCEQAEQIYGYIQTAHDLKQRDFLLELERAEQAERERDRLKAEVKEWKAEATKWRDEAEKVVNDAHARITEQQGQIDTLKAEVEKLKAELAEVVAKKCDACEEVEQTRDGWMVENTRLSENLQAEREAHAKTKAAHEQDIEAAWLQGWEDCYAYASVFTADPTAPDRQEAVARFKASRKGGSDDKG